MSHKYSYSRNKHTHWFLFRFLQGHHKPYQRRVFLILTLSLTPVIFRTDHKILSLKIPFVLVRTWKNVPHNSGIPSTHTHTFKISCIEQRIINLSSNNTSKKKKRTNKTRESRCHRVSCWIWTWTESNHCCPRQGEKIKEITKHQWSGSPGKFSLLGHISHPKPEQILYQTQTWTDNHLQVL